MQSAVPLGQGGMLAVLGIETEKIKTMIDNNFENIKCYLANDNSNGQIILSGKNEELEKFSLLLKEKNIKNIKLPVSAPFHCELMRNATIKMEKIINDQNIQNPKYNVISNVIGSDPRIGHSHMQVPGPDGRKGFGGACFPKDTAAFNAFSEGSFSVLEKVIQENNKYRDQYELDAREKEQNIVYMTR